ncbi:MAG: sugar ABC transporter substrate-binding protein [Alphaproteobacteria bacterium]
MDRREFLTAVAAAGAVTGLVREAKAQLQIPDREFRIGLVAHTLELTGLFGQLREGARARLDEAGVRYEWFEAAPQVSSDHAGLVRLLEDMATAQLDYLMIGPTSLELNEPGLMTFANTGGQLVMTDYERPEGGVPYEDNVLTWVVYRHGEMGYKAGEWLADHFRSVGNFEPKIVILWGPAASSISRDRGNGVLEGLQEATDLKVEVVYEANADFNRDMAYTETERAINAYDFDGLVGMNSATAVAAKNALAANGMLENVTVVGMGGTVEELEAVALREIGVAPYRDPPSMGRACAEAILLHMTDRADEIPPTYYADIPVLDSAYRIRKEVPVAMFDVNGFLNAHYGR